VAGLVALGLLGLSLAFPIVLEGYKDMRAAAEAIDATYNDMRYFDACSTLFSQEQIEPVSLHRIRRCPQRFLRMKAA